MTAILGDIFTTPGVGGLFVLAVFCGLTITYFFVARWIGSRAAERKEAREKVRATETHDALRAGT